MNKSTLDTWLNVANEFRAEVISDDTMVARTEEQARSLVRYLLSSDIGCIRDGRMIKYLPLPELIQKVQNGAVLNQG